MGRHYERSNTLQLSDMAATELSVNYVNLHVPSAHPIDDSHIHDRCEIYVNISGDVVFEVENHLYPVSRGSVILTRPFEYHHCIYRSDKRHEHYCLFFAAQENADFLTSFFNREKGQHNLVQLDEPSLTKLCDLLDGLTQTDISPLSQRIRFLQVLDMIEQQMQATCEPRALVLPPDVAQALCYMDTHLTEPITIAILSAHCNVSVNTLERHFRAALGITPLAMLRQKRLVASAQFLRTGCSVTQAAQNSGFADYSHYIQLFRKQFGVTPMQYQKMAATAKLQLAATHVLCYTDRID